MGFAHLHTHTEYSLLDGAAKIKAVISRVKELGMDAVAITDYGAMYGVVDFYREAKAAGIHPVIGCEVYVAPRSRFDKVHGIDNRNYHLILLAENDIGYRNLIYMVSMGFTEGFYYKPRIDMELLREHSEGLIALSACIAGEIPQALLSGDYDRALAAGRRFVDILGKDNFFIEIQDHGLPEQKQLIPQLVKLSRELGVGLAATNDIHYARREDAKYQDVLMCIQMETNVDDPERMRFETEEFYIKSPEEMAALFPSYPEAIENTEKIAKRCRVDFDFSTRHLPSYEVPEGKSGSQYLRELCFEGLERKYETPSEELRERLSYELGVIESMGFVDYFLIVWDFIHYAKTHGVVVGPGRGSAAGSLTAYCLDITTIDPIRYGLIFERFLNPERVSMPDIDTDFDPDGRQKVIDYVVEKYGSDQVAQIITFGTMKARLAVRDVGRALNIPYGEVDRIAKMIPNELDITIDKALDDNPELMNRYSTEPQVKRLIDTSKALEGLARHSGTHAAGVVITKEPIVNYVPLRTQDNVIITQFPKDTVESLGLLKMDFLGLKNLAVIEDAIDMIEKRTGKRLEIDKTSYEEKKIFDLISSGNTDGVFQVESAGMKSFMQELRPDSIEDIIAGIALYRPGPMDSIPRYVHNKNNPEDVRYKHPLLEPILGVTYGCMVYQEQVMEIVRRLAGYSLGQADILRRVISKKKVEAMEVERHNFIYGLEENGKRVIDGCINRGIDENTAKEIFAEMEDFAKYAFNKSHAAAYAFITYQTAYLKTFYPAEFMAALVSNEASIVKIHRYIENCEEMGIRRLPPDINKSGENFLVEEDGIRFGLSAIKNVGKNLIAALVAERSKNGPFKSFGDFADRMSGADMNKRSLESLIQCGCFDSLGIKRSQLMRVYESVIDGAAKAAKNSVSGQIDLFSTVEESSEVELPDIPEFGKNEILKMEKQMLGMYFSGHPMHEYADVIPRIATCNIGRILSAVHKNEDGSYEILPQSGIFDGMQLVLCGIVESRTNKITRSKSKMAFITLGDEKGSIEVIVFPKQLPELSHMLEEDELVVIAGRLSAREDELPKVICESAKPLAKAMQELESNPGQKPQDPASQAAGQKLFIRIARYSRDAIAGVVRAVAPYQGTIPVKVYFEDTKKTLTAPKEYWFSNTPGALEDIEEEFGKTNVKLC